MRGLALGYEPWGLRRRPEGAQAVLVLPEPLSSLLAAPPDEPRGPTLARIGADDVHSDNRRHKSLDALSRCRCASAADFASAKLCPEPINGGSRRTVVTVTCRLNF